MLDVLLNFCNEKDVKYTVKKNISEISPIGIGGEAMLYALPNTKEKLIDLVEFLRAKDIRYMIVGGMSNVLAQDEFYNGIVISTRDINEVSIEGNCVRANAGVYLPRVITVAKKHSLGGAEELFGIPGTVGGALVSNAGAFGKSISDFLVSVELYDASKHCTVTLYNEELEFSYRSSNVKASGLIVLNAVLSLEQLQTAEIEKRIKLFQAMRSESQPIDARSLGSVFKRYNGIGAGYFIDRCGLKGRSCGGAEISRKHAGFIVNNGGATARDCITLIDVVRQSIIDKFGLELELEIEIMGGLPQNKYSLN